MSNIWYFKSFWIEILINILNFFNKKGVPLAVLAKLDIFEKKDLDPVVGPTQFPITYCHK